MATSLNIRRVLRRERVTKRLIDFVFKGGMTASAIKAHFGDFCDCDLNVWLLAKITAYDPLVISRLQVLLRSDAMAPVEREVRSPPFGKLLDRYCDGNHLMGRFSTGNGAIVIEVLDSDSGYCIVQGPY